MWIVSTPFCFKHSNLENNFCLSGNIVANNSVTICDRFENVNFPTKAAVSKYEHYPSITQFRLCKK